MNNLALKIENLSKQYQIEKTSEKYPTLRASFTRGFGRLGSLFSRKAWHAKSRDTVWALKNVSFELKHGDVIGVIGHNGAGKSTLLKILTRITEPTKGYADVYGRVGSLLEVGTGFHPELTGRENIYMNGAILGMKRAEINHKFDEIVAFSEVEKFIDTPVKHYSSGMYVRLAFAVAAHLEPEILLVDEVLSVGDLAFQEKCLGKMGQVSGQGRTILFVSHNLNAIWSLCPQTIWLDHGELKAFGSTPEVIEQYRNSASVQKFSALNRVQSRQGSKKIRITGIDLQVPDGTPGASAHSGQPVTFRLTYDSTPETRLLDVDIHLIVANDRENRLFTLTNKATGDRFTELPPQGVLLCTIPKLPLIPGEYNLHFACHIRGELADKVLFAAKFTVTEGDFFGTQRLPERYLGDIVVEHQWRAESIACNTRYTATSRP